MSNYSIFQICSNTINDINYCNSIFQTLQFIISIISTMANISNIIISYTSIISHILNTRNISNRRMVESVSARWRKALVAHVKKTRWWQLMARWWQEMEPVWSWGDLILARMRVESTHIIRKREAAIRPSSDCSEPWSHHWRSTRGPWRQLWHSAMWRNVLPKDQKLIEMSRSCLPAKRTFLGKER